MSKMTSLGFAIDLAHKAGSEGRDLTAATVTEIIDEAVRLAAKHDIQSVPMPAFKQRGRVIAGDEVDKEAFEPAGSPCRYPPSWGQELGD